MRVLKNTSCKSLGFKDIKCDVLLRNTMLKAARVGDTSGQATIYNNFVIGKCLCVLFKFCKQWEVCCYQAYAVGKPA